MRLNTIVVVMNNPVYMDLLRKGLKPYDDPIRIILINDDLHNDHYKQISEMSRRLNCLSVMTLKTSVMLSWYKSIGIRSPLLQYYGTFQVTICNYLLQNFAERFIFMDDDVAIFHNPKEVFDEYRVTYCNIGECSSLRPNAVRDVILHEEMMNRIFRAPKEGQFPIDSYSQEGNCNGGLFLIDKSVQGYYNNDTIARFFKSRIINEAYMLKNQRSWVMQEIFVNYFMKLSRIHPASKLHFRFERGHFLDYLKVKPKPTFYHFGVHPDLKMKMLKSIMKEYK